MDVATTTAIEPRKTRRPRSLREVAIWGTRLGETDPFLREFPDTFYAAPEPAVQAAMLAEAPPATGQPRADAYLAAVAEHLALRFGLPVPSWCGEANRFLHRPFFSPAAWSRSRPRCWSKVRLPSGGD